MDKTKKKQKINNEEWLHWYKLFATRKFPERKHLKLIINNKEKT